MKQIILTIVFMVGAIVGQTPQRAPEWVLQNTKGQNVSYYDLKGSVILINFWSVCCATCKPELMELGELHTELEDQGLITIGIGISSGDVEFIRQFKELIGVDIPLLTGNPRILKRILDDFGKIRRIPSLVIIDQEGYVVHKIPGFISKEEMKELLLPLLIQGHNQE